MEATMYDDSFRMASSDFKATKRPVTLDLDAPEVASKKQRLATVLTSPDLNMLKLSSPELERFIISQNGAFATPTPTQFLFPKNVTEEQEKYAKGFVDVLARLHQTSSGPPNVTYFQITEAPSAALSSASLVFCETPKIVPSSIMSIVRPPSVESNSSSSSHQDSQPPVELLGKIKEEPQTVPSLCSSPPISPINLEKQEKIKLERKRYRNRIAATKCRQRKLERISKLEDKVSELKNMNLDLSSTVTKLREQVCRLKQEVLHHHKSGCQIMMTRALSTAV